MLKSPEWHAVTDFSFCKFHGIKHKQKQNSHWNFIADFFVRYDYMTSEIVIVSLMPKCLHLFLCALTYHCHYIFQP